jgi:plastocyanin
LRTALLSLLVAAAGAAQPSEVIHVSGTVTLIRTGGAASGKPDHSNAVVWLKPVRATAPEMKRRPEKFEMRQQHKQFEPHVLVVPAGSQVDFPNRDPFFHNVFSMFDGKRFDLGLYEAGATHSVTFDRPGVCYIFCNIHPEMSAVVVVVDTHYYAVSNRLGEFAIDGVPAGRYMLSVWHERAKPENPREFPREVSITPETAVLAPIRMLDSGQLSISHKNKYGRDYDVPAKGYK